MTSSYLSIAREASTRLDDVEADGEGEVPRMCSTWKLSMSFSGLAMLLLVAGAYLLRDDPCLLKPTLEEKQMVPVVKGEIGDLERELKAIDEAQAAIILANAQKAGLEAVAAGAKVAKTLQAEADFRNSIVNQQQPERATARCILDTLAAAQGIVRIGANLASSLDTCKEDPDITVPGAIKIRKIVCAINSQIVATSLISVASSLATAASECSFAVNKSSSLNEEEQRDADCSSAVTGTVQSIEGLAVSVQISDAGCKAMQSGVPPSVMKALQASGGGEAGRRLFLGGGPGVQMALCVTDGTQAATYLSMMGISMFDAINIDCPAKQYKGLSAKVYPRDIQDLYHSGNKAKCGLDVSKIIYNIGVTTAAIAQANFQCTNTVNLKAICATGITGVVTATDSLAAASQGLYLACDLAQRDATIAEDRVTKASVKYATQVAQKVVDQYCDGDISVACLQAFDTFFGPCPDSSVVTKTCPPVPTEAVCPGVGTPPPPPDPTTCVGQFELARDSLIAMLTPWPPSGPTGIQAALGLVPACFTYLQCFNSSSRRLEAEESPSEFPHLEGLRSELDAVDDNDVEEAARIVAKVHDDVALHKYEKIRQLKAELEDLVGPQDNEEHDGMEFLHQGVKKLAERRELLKAQGCPAL